MDPGVKKRLLEIVDRKEFIDVLKKAFPGKKEITAADLGEEVFRHMIGNVFSETIENHTDPREAFIQRKRGD